MDDTELSGQKEKDGVGEQRTETQLHVALTSMVRHHIICLCDVFLLIQLHLRKIILLNSLIWLLVTLMLVFNNDLQIRN